MKTADIERAIVEHFGEMPDDIARHAGVAAYDLYYGPQSPDDIPDYSFSESCRIVGEWIDETYPGSLYICDESGCVMDREPEGEWYRPETDEYTDEYMGDEDGWCFVEPVPYWELTREDFARAYIHSELVGYCD